MTDPEIRDIFLAHGFTIKEGQSDLKPYVYEAAQALIAHDRAQRVAPAEVLGDDDWQRIADDAGCVVRAVIKQAVNRQLMEKRGAPAEVLEEAMRLALEANAAQPVGEFVACREALRSYLSRHLGAQRVAGAEPVGWMLEKSESLGSTAGIWWVSGTTTEGGSLHLAWSKDPNKGIKFETQEAAEAMFQGFSRTEGPVFATEHIWPSAPPAQAEPGWAVVPDYRGYANLGTGQYLVNHSVGAPAELIISIATEAEKEGRSVGDHQDNVPDAMIQPEDMCVRIRFATEAGLAVLEHQLSLLRAFHFPAPPSGTAGDAPTMEVKDWPKLTKGGGPTFAERKADRVAARTAGDAAQGEREAAAECHDLAREAISDAESAAHDMSGAVQRRKARESCDELHAAIDRLAARAAQPAAATERAEQFSRAWLQLKELPGGMMISNQVGRFGPVPGSCSVWVTTSEREAKSWGNECIEVVLAAKPAAAPDGWQPIETAPKDGTYFVASNPHANGSWVARWQPVATSGYRFHQPWRSAMLNHWYLDEASRYLPPTHWQPLPAAPSFKEGGQ